MPSTLTNFSRTLSWGDFGTPVVRAAPPPGSNSEGAHTWVIAEVDSLGLDKVSGGFRLKDSIVVTIELVPAKTWVATFVFTSPQAFQDSLLAHEQGHYNIGALHGLDLFLALTQLKANTYPNSAKAQADLNAAQQKVNLKAQPLQDRYDTDTNGGLNAAQQALWNGYISKAMTNNGTSGTSPGQPGSSYVSLLDVLAQAGINV